MTTPRRIYLMIISKSPGGVETHKIRARNFIQASQKLMNKVKSPYRVLASKDITLDESIEHVQTLLARSGYSS